MRQVIEILRLKYQHQLSVREIARSCNLAASTVGDYLQRAEAAQLTWPLPEGLTEPELEQRLFAPPLPKPETALERKLPDWTRIQAELRRPNVTLQLLWQESQQADPGALKYSRFCELYRAWSKTLEPTLRQVHVPGEKLFVDWAGQIVPITQADGSILSASVFVAALGASHRIFAEAFPDQKLGSWITAHIHAYEFYGGVPLLTVPDNPKTAVTAASRYEPTLHRTYQDMAEHYGTAILPARPDKPRGKAKVETAVQIAQRQILAALRDLTFFSLTELNQAIKPRLDQLNAQPFQKLEGSRDQWFESLDKPHLKPLPSTPFIVSIWIEATVNIDYHAAIEQHYYSVPYNHIHQRLQVRLTDTTTIEFFHKSQRVAAHARSFQPGKFTTLPEHRPKSHQRYLEWTPGSMVEWAKKIGPHSALAVQQVIASRPHPEQGFRSCLGIIRLAKAHGDTRVEAACLRALHFGAVSYRSIESILAKRLDQQPLESELPLVLPVHDNVRGQTYFA